MKAVFDEVLGERFEDPYWTSFGALQVEHGVLDRVQPQVWDQVGHEVRQQVGMQILNLKSHRAGSP